MEINYSINDIENLAQELLKNLKSKTILFHGGMGVGKTTLIKAVVKHLGSSDEVSSPTFSIINEYEMKNDKIFHFDLYRIKNMEEAYNFGIEDYLDSEHWILIEWPELIRPMLTNNFDEIFLKLTANETRQLILKN
ncbi:tRNA (adenosine(37)-N6)-threonylcarbamoyltransferase complex ATPase subunit type 1 TsaE [Mariniflexile maritimum]|uniref:tRNA (adenosine(37)-N6)-threonylcarbamoyltransferase complex ATPase subunit type 1 TsaE n=1 Tax=Mariniflexile maritimum TaxID=2682493 RepID=UPI0012F653D8|nr:tRNA (adenosine(37)-N6)-threonylcarbamoyltransferase complex ATPase subunit type 1 TsaE [Mariniflexile maritimum]